MSVEDVRLFTCYGKRASGRSYMEKLKEKEIQRIINTYRVKAVNEYLNERAKEFVNAKNQNKISSFHYKLLIKDLFKIIHKFPDDCTMEEINNFNEINSMNEQIEVLEKILNQEWKENDEIRKCNIDYYNQICRLTSKISLINKYINEEKNLIPSHIKDYINKIISDKTIKLGDYIDETLEI